MSDYRSDPSLASVIGKLERRLATIETHLIRGFALPEAKWHNVGTEGEPAFNSTWATQGGGNACGYVKDLSGRVHLRGVVTTNGAASTAVIFTLPEGYRPSEVEVHVAYGITTTPAPSVTTLTIDPSGDVVFAAIGEPNAWTLVLLDNHSFSAA